MADGTDMGFWAAFKATFYVIFIWPIAMIFKAFTAIGRTVR